ncbi:hypothetical protein [Pseudoalteromonas sp. OOF1S-7]|uniref:hypothetical protein n=1 Tax=Pseudoalteromonas sp. OOF1S-7 TaxID=2917757 RepID=UPI001EF6C923|nr:hypothetical protein [Pseudoalteromonas sp. OOF1S-7]MCG7534594.1 hypothetical protein [Pseudoalteromonas sp. OOF1S-7]
MENLALESILVSELSTHGGSEVLKRDDFEYKTLFLNSIEMDPENPRYLPVKLISDHHAKSYLKRMLSKANLIEIYKPREQVLVGYGCLVNCIESGTYEHSLAHKNFKSIADLADNIQRSEVIQVPTVYPHKDVYRILTGHRRFLAMVYSQGIEGVGQFKVYDSEPLFKKVKQFQENTSREDLDAYGKLSAYIDAKLELDTLSQARLKVGEKALTVRSQVAMLGVSAGKFDNYNVLTRYPCVVSLYQKGLSKSFKAVKKVVLRIEEEYRAKSGFDKKVFNKTEKDEINDLIYSALTGSKSTQRNIIRTKPIHSPLVVKQLLQSDITAMDMGVDWSQVNWHCSQEVDDVLGKVIKKLEQLQLTVE